jgi:Tol biopolymer transport system component
MTRCGMQPKWQSAVRWSAVILLPFLLEVVPVSAVVVEQASERLTPSSPNTADIPQLGSEQPSISADGRYVAFQSAATTLVPDDTNTCGDGDYAEPGSCPDVFVHDRLTRETVRISVDSAGNQAECDANGSSGSFHPAISAEGRYVAYASDAINLVAEDTNAVADVFVYDRLTRLTERVSVSTSGAQANGASQGPRLSDDGRFVAFSSVATNLGTADAPPCGTSPEGPIPCEQVFVHDRLTGITEISSVGYDGRPGMGESVAPDISGDGRLVAFASLAANLVADDTNDAWDVFVRDRLSGLTERVSVDDRGNQSGSPSDFGSPALSRDGRFVVFSASSNLLADDVDGARAVFVYDRERHTTERASAGSQGTPANGPTSQNRAAISDDGRYVAFASDASNLVPDDTNGVEDVFVHDRSTGVTARLSLDAAGHESDGRSDCPALSADGRHAAFYSEGTNLLPQDPDPSPDVIVSVSCLGAPDTDRDGLCDPADPCTNVDGQQRFLPGSTLLMTKIGSDAALGNDGLWLAAKFVLPEPFAFDQLDPLLHGTRIAVRSAAGAMAFDAVLQAGAYAGHGSRGWTLRRNGSGWTYSDRTASPAAGITRLTLTRCINGDAHCVQVKAKGRRGSFRVRPGDEPLQLIAVPGAQASSDAGECGESTFGAQGCRFNARQNHILCKVERTR